MRHKVTSTNYLHHRQQMTTSHNKHCNGDIVVFQVNPEFLKFEESVFDAREKGINDDWDTTQSAQVKFYHLRALILCVN